MALKDYPKEVCLEIVLLESSKNNLGLPCFIIQMDAENRQKEWAEVHSALNITE
jgi:hypothetical protein